MSSDAHLAEGLTRDPGQGLAGVYNAYAAKLYTYALTMLRDPAAAQDVVHDSLLVAAGSIGQLRDPGKLRPWLYAITRNECLRTLRARNRFSDSDEVIDVPDETIDIDAGLRRQEASRLIGQGMAAMNPADRDILSLALQHDLDVDRISQITGTKPNAVHARLSRARAGLSDAICALALYRTRGRTCESLAAILAPPEQPLTPLLRKRIMRHIKQCADCERRRRAALAAMGPAMAAPAFVPPPADLLTRIQHSLHQGHAAPLSQAARPFDAEGFPRPLDARRSPTWLLPAAAILAGVLLLVFGLFAITDRSSTTSDSSPITGAAPISPQPSGVGASSTASPTLVEPSLGPDDETATVTEPSPPATTPATSPPTVPRSATKNKETDRQDSGKSSKQTKAPAPPKSTPAPTAAAPPQTGEKPVVQPPVITGVALMDMDKAADGGFTRCDSFTLRVTATVTGEVDTVRAVIAPLGSTIALAGVPHEGAVTLPAGEYSVSVEATGPGGRTTRDAGTVLHICPG